MNDRRRRQVAAILRRELSDIIQQEVKDPRVGLASITRVEVSPDMSYARVYVSVFAGEEERREAIEALTGAQGFVRRQLAPRIRLRTIPRLNFLLDQSLEHAENISRLLNQIDTPTDHSSADSTERATD